MSDYIKREDVLAVIYGQHVGGKEACENARPNTFGADLREIASDIEDIPASDVVERKKGEWIYDCERQMSDGWTYRQRHCSLCGFQTVECVNFCQNCGADMREES